MTDWRESIGLTYTPPVNELSHSSIHGIQRGVRKIKASRLISFSLPSLQIILLKPIRESQPAFSSFQVVRTLAAIRRPCSIVSFSPLLFRTSPDWLRTKWPKLQQCLSLLTRPCFALLKFHMTGLSIPLDEVAAPQPHSGCMVMLCLLR